MLQVTAKSRLLAAGALPGMAICTAPYLPGKAQGLRHRLLAGSVAVPVGTPPAVCNLPDPEGRDGRAHRVGLTARPSPRAMPTRRPTSRWTWGNSVVGKQWRDSPDDSERRLGRLPARHATRRRAQPASHPPAALAVPGRRPRSRGASNQQEITTPRGGYAARLARGTADPERTALLRDTGNAVAGAGSLSLADVRPDAARGTHLPPEMTAAGFG